MRAACTILVLGFMMLAFASASAAAEGPRFRVSPTRATLESLALPGLGQIHAGDRLRGAAVMGFEGYLIARVFIENARASDDHDRALEASGDEAAMFEAGADLHRQRRDDLIFWSSVAHMFNMLDAYVAAHLSEIDEEMEEVEALTLRAAPTPGGGEIVLSWSF